MPPQGLRSRPILAPLERLVPDVHLVADRHSRRTQLSIDAHTDPWGQDGRRPATPGQFRTALPLVDLPAVPVR